MNHKELKHISACFGCGKDNPCGLKANFKVDDKKIIGEFVPQGWQKGFRGYLHGGLIGALLDEALAQLLNRVICADGPTGYLEVRYRKPARLDKKLLLSAVILKDTKKILYAKATIQYEDGTLIGEAKGKLIKGKL
jgi:acyl-coenzyme A thioesterase PaaI-like protein